MKKILINIIFVGMCVMIFACAKVETIEDNTIKNTESNVNDNVDNDTKNVVDNSKYVELAKNFYTEYLNEFNNFEDDFIGRLSNIKKKYMTDTMIEEMELRSRQTDADSIIEAQDEAGMLSNMEVKSGKESNWAQVIFDDKTNNSKRIFNLHFKEVDGKTLIDAIDSTVIEKDVDGKLIERTTKTKYANKETLTDDDKKEMESIKKHYDDLEEQGFIG